MPVQKKSGNLLNAPRISLTSKKPHVEIFRQQVAPKIKLQHYLQNSGAKGPPSGQKFKSRQLKKLLEIIEKKTVFFFCVVLFKFKNKYLCLATYGD